MQHNADEVEDYEAIQMIADGDVRVLRDKGKTYGRSWIKRGGVGAAMMMLRKIDRIENIIADFNWDIIKAGTSNTGQIMDDIGDLRRYLLLVEAEVKRMNFLTNVAEPGPHYVDPDRGGGTG